MFFVVKPGFSRLFCIFALSYKKCSIMKMSKFQKIMVSVILVLVTILLVMVGINYYYSKLVPSKLMYDNVYRYSLDDSDLSNLNELM